MFSYCLECIEIEESVFLIELSKLIRDLELIELIDLSFDLVFISAYFVLGLVLNMIEEFFFIGLVYFLLENYYLVLECDYFLLKLD